MSLLYEKLEKNIKDINSLFKSGINLRSNGNFYSPVNAEVDLVYLGKGSQAKPCLYEEMTYNNQEGYNMYGSPSITFGIMSKFLTKYIMSISVKSNKKLTISNKDYYIDLSGKSISFGEHELYNNTAGAYYDFIDVNPSDIQNGKVVKVSVKENIEKNNTFPGDFELTLTNYREWQDWDELKIFRHTYMEATAQVSNIFRQPSSSPAVNPYLKIKYNDNVINLNSDIYF